jgi:DNA-binding transcriptional LysR family regulator
MDIDELRALVGVAEAGTVTAAAERLYVSQPALSERIKRLERAVGTTLFVRDGRGMTLTAEGEAYLPHVRQALVALERGREAVCAVGRERRLLRVDVLDPSLAVPRELVAHLRAALPEADVEVSGSGSGEQMQRLRAGTIDLALAMDGAPPGGVEQLAWAAEPLVVALPDNHRLARATSVVAQDLAHETHYLPREEFAPEWNALVRRLCARNGLPLNEIGIRADTSDAPLDLVAAGECVAVSLASTRLPPGAVTRPLEPTTMCAWVLRVRTGWRDELPWLVDVLAR